MPCWPSRTTAPGSPVPDGRCGPIRRLTAAALDRYASQLALPRGPGETSAPIRARVQHELATVRAEQNARASSGPADPPRRYDASGLTAGELDRTRRELAASLAPDPAGLTGPRADPGAPGRHRRRTRRTTRRLARIGSGSAGRLMAAQPGHGAGKIWTDAPAASRSDGAAPPRPAPPPHRAVRFIEDGLPGHPRSDQGTDRPCASSRPAPAPPGCAGHHRAGRLPPPARERHRLPRRPAPRPPGTGRPASPARRSARRTGRPRQDHPCLTITPARSASSPPPTWPRSAPSRTHAPAAAPLIPRGDTTPAG